MANRYDVIIGFNIVVLERDYVLGVVERILKPEEYLNGPATGRIDKEQFDRVIEEAIKQIANQNFDLQDIDYENTNYTATTWFSVPYPRQNLKSIYRFYKTRKLQPRQDSRIDVHPRSGKEYYIDFSAFSFRYQDEFSTAKETIAKKVQKKLFKQVSLFSKKSMEPESLADVIKLVQQFFVTENGRVGNLSTSRQKMEEFNRWYNNVEEWKKSGKRIEIVGFNAYDAPKKLALLLSVLLDIKEYLKKLGERMIPTNYTQTKQKSATLESVLERSLKFLDRCNGFLSKNIVSIMVDICEGGVGKCDAEQTGRILEMFCTGELNENSLMDFEFSINEKRETLGL